jgi:hypothetical protein
MATSVKDSHPCPIEGVEYRFRTPSLYDPAKARRILTLQRVRRPALAEFRVASLAGIAALADTAGMPEEGARQCALIEEWYRIMDPIREDDLDEPDSIRRGEELVRRETERRERIAAIYPDVLAIEANLERHWQAYAELKADREYWDDISRIEIVRLLVTHVAGVAVDLDDEGMMAPPNYQAIPAAHRMPLATFGFGLLSPNEARRKN